MGDPCVFCEIVAGRAPAEVVRRWDDALAIVPLDPVARGHLLVLPTVHVQTFFSNPDVSAATMRRAAELLHGVERHHEPRDHNVITSAGAAATQTVPHLHVHIVPREHGDGLHLPWTNQRPSGSAEPPPEPCCTYVDHGGNNPACACPEHPKSSLHPFGDESWLADRAAAPVGSAATTRPRRMAANEDPYVENTVHAVEHDENPFCYREPRCAPVRDGEPR